MLFSQFAPILVYLQFSFCFCLYSTPTMAQLSRLFWSFWLLSVFVQIVPDLGSGSGLGFGFGFGPGHGHRKRYSGIFQQFIALCYFAEQVFWSSGLAACLPAWLCMYMHLCLYLYLCLCYSDALCWHWKLVPSVCAIATPPVTRLCAQF